MATPKIKYDRSYTESLLWLLVLFLLLLVFTVPFRHLIVEADLLSMFYAEHEERTLKCRKFLDNEIRKNNGGTHSSKQDQPSLGEMYFLEMFPEESSDVLSSSGMTDCDTERSLKTK